MFLSTIFGSKLRKIESAPYDPQKFECYNAKGALYMLNYYSWVTNFTPFRSTIIRLQRIEVLISASGTMVNLKKKLKKKIVKNRKLKMSQIHNVVLWAPLLSRSLKTKCDGGFGLPIYPPLSVFLPSLRSTLVGASARGAGGRGSIPDRVTPKT